MRPELSSPPVTDHCASKMVGFRADAVSQVRLAVAAHDVVVVGMGWNPHVRRARRALEAASIEYHYLGFGNYLTGWKPRLAIKLWSGWPTFPQVFVRGRLVGGASETEHLLAQGELLTEAVAQALPTPPSEPRL
jgi:glutaredoxin-related protein